MTEEGRRQWEVTEEWRRWRGGGGCGGARGEEWEWDSGLGRGGGVGTQDGRAEPASKVLERVCVACVYDLAAIVCPRRILDQLVSDAWAGICLVARLRRRTQPQTCMEKGGSMPRPHPSTYPTHRGLIRHMEH